MYGARSVSSLVILSLQGIVEYCSNKASSCAYFSFATGGLIMLRGILQNVSGAVKARSILLLNFRSKPE